MHRNAKIAKMSSSINKPELLVHSRYHLTESPHWCPKRNKVFYVDISNRFVICSKYMFQKSNRSFSRIVCSYDPKNGEVKQIQVK